MTVKRDRVRAKRVFKDFLKLLPESIRVTELRKAHLSSYQEKRLADGVKAATVKREMVPIIAVLNNADSFYAELDGYTPPKKPKLTISKTRKTVTLQHNDRLKLLKHLLSPQNDAETAYQAASRRRVGLFLQFSLLTVSRPGETAAVRRSHVDFHTGIVTIKGTKTANKTFPDRQILITPTIREILTERMGISKGEFLFTKGGKVTARMYDRIKAACEAVGIPYGRHNQDGFTFYTARHTATTVLQHSNKVDLKTAGAYTGHSDEAMTMYYTHSNPETLQVAGEVLEENMGSRLLDGEFLETIH